MNHLHTRSLFGLTLGCLVLVGCEDDGGGDDGVGDASDTAADTTDTGTEETGETGNETEGETTSDDIVTWEVRVDQFEIKPVETFYACFDFPLQLDQLGHIVGFRPVIDNAPYVHHFVMSLVPTAALSGSECYDIGGPILYGWAPGQEEYLLPEEAGMLIGDQPDGIAVVRLQIHYNNPLGDIGQIDNSGVDVLITQNLRPNNAGAFTVGDISGIAIPPGDPAYEHTIACQSGWTQANFPEPINIFGSSLHAHELGSVLWTDVFRDGQMMGEINRDDPFGFENQNFKAVDWILEPGDELVNHCVYDSTDRTETTYGGVGTFDEMCWDTFMYYPASDSDQFLYCGGF